MAALDRRRAVDEFVAEPLVIPLPVVMGDELRDRPAQMTFAEPRGRGALPRSRDSSSLAPTSPPGGQGARRLFRGPQRFR